MLEVIAAWPTPVALRKAGRARIDAKLKAHGAKRHAVWAQALVDALTRQTVVVAGTDATGVVLPHLARQLISLHAQRHDVATQVEALVAAHPHLPGPDHPCPASGSRPQPSSWPRPWATPSRPGLNSPPTQAWPPSHAAQAHRSAARGVSHGGNKRLKRAMFGSAFASLRSASISRAHYNRKIAQGKRHNQVLLALAHRRIPTLHAMLRDSALYTPQPAQPLATAA